ncbi:uncharacterized protein C24H6.02c [Impatiens glandulifera]|uniref:uncharacterized protein C24H6.02c n=1 Tax=Impatiens glandulifera TaxID=253017 RepID=UPI001FB19E36|nr:uncharacterized protein C24H6.02c [Impatiens glandulifera]
MAAIACSFKTFSSISYVGSRRPNSSLNSFLRLNFPSRPISISSRLRISFQVAGADNRSGFPLAACLGDSRHEEAPIETGDDSKEAIIDLKLPRRSMLLRFTCNSCGERTQRMINRLAYERGTVFVQCAGCLKHHKLVDNLGLVIEYDFREENETDSLSD